MAVSPRDSGLPAKSFETMRSIETETATKGEGNGEDRSPVGHHRRIFCNIFRLNFRSSQRLAMGSSASVLRQRDANSIPGTCYSASG